jgi:hypothetical protein
MPAGFVKSKISHRQNLGFAGLHIEDDDNIDLFITFNTSCLLANMAAALFWFDRRSCLEVKVSEAGERIRTPTLS